MIIEIALGIVLAVIILAFLPAILAMGIVAAGIALIIGVIALAVMAIQFDLAFTSIVVLLLLPVAIVHWRDNKKLEGIRKSLGYEDSTDSKGLGK